ncbi:MAG: DUF192 domain-containing protein [Actinomycetota bacterium]|nr:DUF192 domain-containing protein [Actinomycetota bacterium]
MQTGSIKNKKININIKVIKATGYFEKLSGLIVRKLKENEIFLIDNCNGVHTFWMTRKIDIIFLNKYNKVIDLYKYFKTFRFTPFIKNSVAVIEAEAGFIDKYEICCGDILSF